MPITRYSRINRNFSSGMWGIYLLVTGLIGNYYEGMHLHTTSSWPQSYGCYFLTVCSSLSVIVSPLLGLGHSLFLQKIVAPTYVPHQRVQISFIVIMTFTWVVHIIIIARVVKNKTQVLDRYCFLVLPFGQSSIGFEIAIVTFYSMLHFIVDFVILVAKRALIYTAMEQDLRKDCTFHERIYLKQSIGNICLSLVYLMLLGMMTLIHFYTNLAQTYKGIIAMAVFSYQALHVSLKKLIPYRREKF